MTDPRLLPILRDLYGRHVTAYHGRNNTLVRGVLSDEELLGHLEGRWRDGTYFDPGDGMVVLGVIDLDNKENPDGEKPHAKRAAEVLADLGIVAEIFTSKGKGYHVTTYWSEAVPAEIVRKVLRCAAAKAGRPGAEVFPKQDRVDAHLPSPGSRESARVGSYINLPWNGADLPRGRTALVDKGNGLDPYPDQVEAAEGIRKNSPENLMAALSMVEKESSPPAPKPTEAASDKLSLERLDAVFENCAELDGLRRNAIEAGRLLPENRPGEHFTRIRVMNLYRAFEGGPERAVQEVFSRLEDYDSRETEKQIASLRGAPPPCAELCPAGLCDAIKARGKNSPIAFAYPVRLVEAPSPSAPKASLVFPAEVLTGAAGEFARLYASHIEAPPHFFFMSFLTSLGVVVSDRLTLRSELKPQPRLYTLLLGESADDRKSTAISKTVEFFRTATTDFPVCWGVGSAEGLQTRMEKENRLLLALDEFRQFVSKSKIEASVLLPCVTTLFESNRYESHTKQSTVQLERAHLSILAASTISTYENTWSSQFTDIGFNNRLWLVPGGAERRFSIPEKASEMDRFRVCKMLGKVLEHIDQHRELDVTPAGKELYHEWYMQLPRSIYAKRLDTYALRLMSLLASNDLKPEVDEETVRKVIALCDHQYRVRELHDPIDANNEAAKLEEKIRRTLRAKGAMSERNLKRAVHADRTGIWLYEMARKNLCSEGELRFDRKTKSFLLTEETK